MAIFVSEMGFKVLGPKKKISMFLLRSFPDLTQDLKVSQKPPDFGAPPPAE